MCIFINYSNIVNFENSAGAGVPLGAFYKQHKKDPSEKPGSVAYILLTNIVTNALISAVKVKRDEYRIYLLRFFFRKNCSGVRP